MATVDPDVLFASQYDPLAALSVPDPLGMPDHSKRDEHETKLAHDIALAFLSALAVTKALDWSGISRDWTKHGWSQQMFAEQVTAVFVREFADALTPILVGAAVLGQHYALQGSDLLHPANFADLAFSWAAVYARAIAGEIGRQSQDAVQDQVNGLVNTRLSAPMIADRIQEMYGLTKRDAVAYANYTTGKRVDRTVALPQIAMQLITRRASLIGTNEAFSAINFGKQLLWMQAMQDGTLPKETKKAWVTALDERVCPVCKPMDGVVVPMTEFFEIVSPRAKGLLRPNMKILVPPAHPSCRCTIVLSHMFARGAKRQLVAA